MKSNKLKAKKIVLFLTSIVILSLVFVINQSFKQKTQSTIYTMEFAVSFNDFLEPLTRTLTPATTIEEADEGTKFLLQGYSKEDFDLIKKTAKKEFNIDFEDFNTDAYKDKVSLFELNNFVNALINYSK